MQATAVRPATSDIIDDSMTVRNINANNSISTVLASEYRNIGIISEVPSPAILLYFPLRRTEHDHELEKEICGSLVLSDKIYCFYVCDKNDKQSSTNKTRKKTNRHLFQILKVGGKKTRRHGTLMFIDIYIFIWTNRHTK